MRMTTFLSIHDLNHSSDFETKNSYTTFINILDKIFGKHDTKIPIIVDEKCEEHQQFIKDNWKVLSNTFHLKPRIKSTKKLVRQTLKHIIDYFNDHFKLQQPVEFKLHVKAMRIGKNTSNHTYTSIKLP